MKLHFIGLPHTETLREYEWCAYTQKLLHMGQICKMIGYETVLYGSDKDEGQFGEVVEVVTQEDRDKWFGYINWDIEVFNGWNPSDPWWVEMNLRSIEEIQKRIEPQDIVCIIAGRCQESIARAFPNHKVLEWAVGYEGVLNLDNTFRCFESEIWRHFIYGRNGINDGAFFDAVIPNSFDSKDFIFKKDKDDYCLFLGRLTPRKGLPIIEEIAKHHKIITAGQGDIRIPGTEHVGVVRGRVKSELIAGAKALICPTTYIEPFGGVAVEALLSGTPVITTDFGAFTETVDKISGFRCHTLKEFLDAVNSVDSLSPHLIRSRAIKKYTLEAVGPSWLRWYQQIESLYSRGWYEGA